MGGTPSGGRAAYRTNINKYGPDFMKRIGAKGGAASGSGGFAAGEAGRERARFYGAIGGSISRRGGQEMDKKRQEARTRVLVKKYEANYKRLQQIAQAADKARKDA